MNPLLNKNSGKGSKSKIPTTEMIPVRGESSQSATTSNPSRGVVDIENKKKRNVLRDYIPILVRRKQQYYNKNKLYAKIQAKYRYLRIKHLNIQKMVAEVNQSNAFMTENLDKLLRRPGIHLVSIDHNIRALKDHNKELSKLIVKQTLIKSMMQEFDHEISNLRIYIKLNWRFSPTKLI